MRSFCIGSLILALGLACGGADVPDPSSAPAPSAEVPPGSTPRPAKEVTRFEGWVEPSNWDETDMFGLTTSDHGVVWFWCKDMAICRPLSEHGHAPGGENWMYAIDARKPTKAERASREMSDQAWIVVSMTADNAGIEPGMN